MDPITQNQFEVFKNLINELLCSQDVHVEQLQDTFEGTSLPKFVQVLIGETIQGWKEIPDSWKAKPMFKSRVLTQASANLSAIIKHLATKDNFFKNARQPESDKDKVGFLWLIISKFYIVQPKRTLIATFAQNLKEFEPGVEVKNMGSSWANGLPFIALLSKASKGTIEYSDKGDFESNFNYIKESCETLKIPFVLTKQSLTPKPDENCICVQAISILKSMDGVEAPAPQSSTATPTATTATTSNDAKKKQDESKMLDEKKKLDEKINEYKKVLQEALDTIKTEQNQIDKMSLCLSQAEIDEKRNYIHKFNASIKKSCQDQFFKVRDSFSVVERNSNRTKIPIPSDLTKPEDVKQKLDQLEKSIRTVSANLESDEAKLKQYVDDINSLSTLHESRDKFNELKGHKIDMDNWQQKPHNSIVYKLGQKVQYYENQLKNTIANFNDNIQKFNSKHDQIAQMIEDKTEDVIQLDHLVSSLDSTIFDIDQEFRAAQQIDNTVELEFPREEMESKVASDKKKIDEYKAIQSVMLFEKEYDNISSKCNDISLEIEKIDSEYKNYYSTNLKKTVNYDHPIEIPNCNHLEYLLKAIEANNNEFEQKLEEAKKLIEKTQSSYDQVFVFLVQREEESQRIYDSSSLAHSICQKFKKLDLGSSIPIFAEAKEQILMAENMKNWDENAKGETIEEYNRLMEEANEIIQNGTMIVEEKFNTYLEEVKESLDKVKSDYLDETDDYEKDRSNYKKGLKILKETVEKFDVLKITADKMELNKKDELDEIGDEINRSKEKVEKLIEDFPERIKLVVESKNERFASYPINDLIDELKQDNSNLDELSDKKIDQKGSDYISEYAKILKDRKIMENYIKEFEFDIEINDTKEITDILHDLIIIYRSTLLLSPNSFAEGIIDRCENCSDSKFSQMMALLYAEKFTAKSCKFGIENLSAAKGKIESKVNSDKTFSVEISKQICRRIAKYQTIEKEIELNILMDFITYLQEFEESLRNYLVTSIGSNTEIRLLKDILEDMDYVPEKLTEILTESLEKVNALTKAKLLEVKKDPREEKAPIICDFGTYETKMGFAGQIEPTLVIPTVTGKNNFAVSMIPGLNIYIGEDALNSSHKLQLSYPVYRGIGTDWDNIDELMKYSFNKLRVDCEDHPILCCEKISTSKCNREKVVQFMFETMKFPSFYTVNSAVLALYSTGRTTGISVDVGHDIVSYVPIYDGYSLYNFYNYSYYGGKDITKHLMKNLAFSNEFLYTSSGNGILDKIKKNKCRVDLDSYSRNKVYSDQFTLSDGSTMDLGDEIVSGPEILFNPSVAYLDGDGIPQVIFNTVNKLNSEIQKKMYSNIFVSGSTANISNFIERVGIDVRKLVPEDINVDVIKPEFRNYAAFVGGSIFAQTADFFQVLISHDEYNDAGPGIVHRKCIY